MSFDSSPGSWTRYWRAGNQDTCFTASGSFSIEQTWREFFESLAAGSAILDLATGNGTVALIAARVGEEKQRDFHISAVDQADIDPGGSLKNPSSRLDSIEFIPNTFLEDLPFTESRFDAVCSQFGFEYSDTAKAIPQIARVCKPGARLCLIIHAQSGEVERSSKSRLNRVKALIAGDSALELAKEIARLQLDASLANHARLQKLETRFWSKLRKSHKKLEGLARDDVALNSVNYLGTLMQDRRRIAAVELDRLIRDLDGELHAYVVRLNTMIGAARSEQDMEEIIASLAANGFSNCRYEAIDDEKGVVAWQLQAAKH